MSKPLEDYAIIGDCRSAALIARDGSIDWLCLPRFDSNACFAALLGTESHGYWRVAPTASQTRITRRYAHESLILETTFETDSGAVVLRDFMPPLTDKTKVIRTVRALRGTVEMRNVLSFRFDYGAVLPWINESKHGFTALAGPNMIQLQCKVPLKLEEDNLIATFSLSEGESTSFVLSYQQSHYEPDEEFWLDPEESLEKTRKWWADWAARCTYDGAYKEEVVRSLITLKALTYLPTGGIIAAATTSLPEHLGGVRNWDYRYCWIRDSSLILQAFLRTGYPDEARRWHDWLLRAVAAEPRQMQIMYGIAGERRLLESELDWLPGYENSRPVRLGNQAFTQSQLDIYGEIMTCYYLSRHSDLPTDPREWDFLKKMMSYLEEAWQEEDEGIWEIRGETSHFTYSKFMCWVGFDHAIRSAEEFKLDAPLERWREVRDKIHADICRNGFDENRCTFVQAYGSSHLDASLLRMAIDRFLPADDPRIRGMITSFEEQLINEEFVFRYHPAEDVDGLPGKEGAFLMCSFWLADNYILTGRRDKAARLFEKLLALRNDVGLLSEEYDCETKRLIGNFPQGFSHMGLILTALNLAHPEMAKQE